MEDRPALEHLQKVAKTEGSVPCGICGSSLSDRAQVCAHCHSPYHSECWEYAGG